MNYRKTNTIQNNRTINISGFLSSLLLFFLLISCGGRHGVSDGVTRPANRAEETNKKSHDALMERIGGIGPCTYECLANQFIELAEQNHKKGKTIVKTIEDQESWVIPNTKDGKFILQLITDEKIVGNAEGKKKWRQILSRRKKADGKVREGIYGLVGEMLKLLSASDKEQHRDPIIYTALLLMELRTQLDTVQSWHKAALIAQYSAALTDFETKLNAVSPTSNGVRIIITPPTTAEGKAQLKFHQLTEVKKSKKHQKPYRLPEDLHKKLLAKYAELKQAVEGSERLLE